MIYLTAQPSDRYFFWQLELQVRNLRDIGVSPKYIHVLIASPQEGKSKSLSVFIKNNGNLCNIFLYEDTRIDRDYPSSIRPHIIWKHFEMYPFLESECIFYYDSDVLLKRRIDNALFGDDICYVSDTRSYISSSYIVDEGSKSLLNNMAQVVGIDASKIVELDQNAGGAQYILKGMDSSLWKKIERDSSILYSTIRLHNDIAWKREVETNKNAKRENVGMSPWCADMWALLWNLQLFDKVIRIHKELDFLWPDDNISLWGDKIVLHYTGFKKSSKAIFDKTQYIDNSPWFDKSLFKLSEKTCSHVVFSAIQRRKEEIQTDLPRIDHLSIMLSIPEVNDEVIERFLKTDSFYRKYLNISIYLKSGDYEFYTWSDKAGKLLRLPYKEFKESKRNWTGAFLMSQLDFLFDPIDLLMISKTTDVKLSYRLKADILQACPLLIGLFFNRLDLGVFKFNTGKFDKLSSGYEQLYVVDSKSFFRGPQRCSHPHQFSCFIRLNHEVYVL